MVVGRGVMGVRIVNVHETRDLATPWLVVRREPKDAGALEAVADAAFIRMGRTAVGRETHVAEIIGESQDDVGRTLILGSRLSPWAVAPGRLP